MNDLEDRLEHLLTRVAEAVDVHPDLDAVRTGSPAAGGAGQRGRALVVLVAAAVVALAVVGVVRHEEGPPVAAGAAARFPVLGPLPAGVDGPVRGQYVFERHPMPAGEQALFGRRQADGSVADPIAVRTYATRPGRLHGEITTVGPDGLPAEEVRSGAITSLLLPGEPTAVVTGQDPRALFTGPSPFSFAAGELVVGALPLGFETIVAPRPVSPDPERPMVVVDTPSDRLAVQVFPELPIEVLASLAGDLRPTEVDGHAGWSVRLDRATVLVWSMGPGTTVLLDTTLGLQDALDVAEDVRLVDEDRWRRRYDVNRPTETTAVTVSVTGSTLACTMPRPVTTGPCP